MNALPLSHVRLVKVLIDHIAFGLVQFLAVRSRKMIEDVLDRREHHRSCRRRLAPIEHQLFLLQLRQQRPRHLFHFCRLLLCEHHFWLGRYLPIYGDMIPVLKEQKRLRDEEFPETPETEHVFFLASCGVSDRTWFLFGAGFINKGFLRDVACSRHESRQEVR